LRYSRVDFHVSAHCYTHTLVTCLQQIKTWSKSSKGHTVIPIILEFNIPDHPLIFLSDAKNKVIFLMDYDPITGLIRNPYRADGHDNLKKWDNFTNSVRGEPDTAFLERGDPRGENLGFI
jgi:hypothetical protein